MIPKRIVVNDKERFAAWALERIGYPDSWSGGYEAIGLETDGPEVDGWSGRGEILAAAVFTDFVPNLSVQLHLAGKPGALWASPIFISAWFRTAFLQWNCRRITAPIAAGNHKCRALAEHVGFTLEGTIRHGLPHDHLCVYGILLEESGKWLTVH